MRGQKHERNGVGQKAGERTEIQAGKKEEDRKGCAEGGNEIGRNHPQEEGETGQEEPKENRKQPQQATDWRNHEGRFGRTGEPRVVEKPSLGKCSGSGGLILGGDGNVRGGRWIEGGMQWWKCGIR